MLAGRSEFEEAGHFAGLFLLVARRSRSSRPPSLRPVGLSPHANGMMQIEYSLAHHVVCVTQ